MANHLESPHTAGIKDALWNDLLIDVNAEFFPVRVPLKQLKEMTEGLIVEVGDLVHNDVRLHVEGKTVATGELVIVGDKFGLRIRHIEGGNPVSVQQPNTREPDKNRPEELPEPATPEPTESNEESSDPLTDDFEADEPFDDEDDW